jgi:glucose/arabinose dehydrogenase
MRRVALLLLLVLAPRAFAETARIESLALGLSEVTAIANAGDGTGRLFFATQPGLVHVHANGQLQPQPFLDLRPLVHSGLDGGLSALAFHPDFETNRFFYVIYQRLDFSQVVVRYRASAADPNVADPSSAFVIIELSPQGLPSGRDLAFGPDGFLYVATADAIPFSAQDLGSLRGKILRIDVNGGTPYAIPAGNPFVGVPGARPEVFAYGLANPWGLSFDRATGDLFVADNGGLSSEIDILPPGTRGQNFGFPIVQGATCFQPPTGCSTAGLTAPIVVRSATVVGGYRYRGAGIPLLQGFYVFGPSLFSDNTLSGARPDPAGVWSATPLVEAGEGFSTGAFGQDEAGELLVSNFVQLPGGGHGVYRIVASSSPSTVSIGQTEPQVTEGATITWTVALSVAHLAGPVTVGYATEDGTAVAGEDYVATSGTLTFLPGVSQLDVVVPTIEDERNEVALETLGLRLTDPQGVVLGASAATGTIVDDDQPPTILPGSCTAVEGNAGTTPCTAEIALDVASGQSVVVHYATAPGTASESDYDTVFGQLTFAPGVRTRTVTIPIRGDVRPEDNESFQIAVSESGNPSNGGVGQGLILDDDGTPAAGLEIEHGSVVRGDHLGNAPDVFRLAQAPAASYELVLDEGTGDAAVRLERLSADGVTVAQSAQPLGASAVRLRWQNPTAATVVTQALRVSPACAGACGADDRYRLRLFDTTLRGARFNNAGGQRTVLILQNTEPTAVQANVWFWRSDGSLLRELTVPIPARGGVVVPTFDTAGLIGRSGSLTITHDGGYGTLVGKVVSLEPGTGSSFDTPLVPRPH